MSIESWSSPRRRITGKSPNGADTIPSPTCGVFMARNSCCCTTFSQIHQSGSWKRNMQQRNLFLKNTGSKKFKGGECVKIGEIVAAPFPMPISSRIRDMRWFWRKNGFKQLCLILNGRILKKRVLKLS